MNAQMKACWNRRFSVGAPNSRNEGVPGIAGFRWEASVGGFRWEPPALAGGAGLQSSEKAS
jgi:hypothetical protein